ncbi:MAG: hypothetical protein A2W76_00640 [Gammaproteobacteria bacterium RIFCSPLOWO2_12_47_11]|nr:MAG: hypothetical protein A2W76_00640 [Gammaproteobacteria bacterium RIFCSPLOWO2_12_47_11]
MMIMNTTRKQAGFTLVEIAIVLVIIGLLLGGILKGQQLINSARVRNMADQNSGVQAAYFGFIDRFRQIPGDMPGAAACAAIGSVVTGCGGTPVGGNQNGRIDTWVEAGAVWNHLSASGFLNGSYTGSGTTSAATYIAGPLAAPPAVPANAFQQAIMLAYTDDYEAGTGTASVRLAYAFGASIQPSMLRELDVKLDDGSPVTGVMRPTVETANTGEPGDDMGAALIWTGTPACVTGAGTATATYNVDSDNTSCNAVFLY